MKQIKFRAWDKKEKRWVTNEEWLRVVPISASLKLPSICEIMQDEYEVMQFTGLTDKQGKEIYEGDIVSRLPKRKRGEYYEPKVVEWYLAQNHNGFNIAGKNWEVIGNIYKNPNLIK